MPVLALNNDHYQEMKYQYDKYKLSFTLKMGSTTIPFEGPNLAADKSGENAIRFMEAKLTDKDSIYGSIELLPNELYSQSPNLDKLLPILPPGFTSGQ